ncbi:MAG TPA: aminodeoxychorismate lyase [Rhodanobacteraceae bacterium]
MTPRCLVNGVAATSVPADDRGLRYGDGLFETLWLHAGRVPLWERHMARLQHGCERLGFVAPDADTLWRETLQAATGLTTAVVRITVTRGCGRRGYAPPPVPEPMRMVSAASASHWPDDWYHAGIAMHLCGMRLAIQPALAGLKHLNRLEQVLARSEWTDPTIAEGLMLDLEDRVACATSANVFALIDGRLYTPPVTRCGVAGTARAQLLEQYPDTVVADLTLHDLQAADGVFLTNAVRGIVPVRQLADHVWPIPPALHRLQHAWRAAGLPGPVAA